MINTDYLKTFQALIETNSFTKTALLLHMTQPGVSQHIKKLEEHFQTELIKRLGKTFTITESGRRLIDYSSKLFLEYDHFKDLIGKDDPFSGPCKYASPGSFGFSLFDTLIESAKKYPKLLVSLKVSPNYSIPQLLLNREIDIGFMTKVPDEHNLEYKKFGEEEMLLIVPKGQKVRSFKDLQRIGAVNHPDGPLLKRRLFTVNFPQDINQIDTIPSRIFINQTNRILDPVSEGLGFAVVAEGVYAKCTVKNKISVCKLKIRVADEIYQVQRREESLPARYQTIANFLIKKMKK